NSSDRLPFSAVREPSQLQQKMRTKRALPRNPWARNRNVNQCAEPRRKPAKKRPCEGHFCLTKIRREIVTSKYHLTLRSGPQDRVSKGGIESPRCPSFETALRASSG